MKYVLKKKLKKGHWKGKSHDLKWNTYRSSFIRSGTNRSFSYIRRRTWNTVLPRIMESTRIFVFTKMDCISVNRRALRVSTSNMYFAWQKCLLNLPINREFSVLSTETPRWHTLNKKNSRYSSPKSCRNQGNLHVCSMPIGKRVSQMARAEHISPKRRVIGE